MKYWLTAMLLSVAPVQAATLDDIVAYVTEVTHELPNRFQDHGNLIREEDRMKPLAGDVLAYARVYWTTDYIEGNCEFIGQRSNVEMLDPDNGITSWVMTAAMSQDHPDYKEYFSIYEKFDAAVTELGEAVLCPAMYKLLGPDGTLMSDALDINGLLDPQILGRWEVRAEDGILWSSKDYCERRYYLPTDQSGHDFACKQANEQDF